MPAVWSKPVIGLCPSVLLSNVKYVDDLQDALVAIECCEQPDDFKAVTELFVLYIEKEVTAAAGRLMWVCTYSFNNDLETSWPDEF